MSERYPRQRRNLLAFGGDYIAFAVAMGLLSVNIVLPDFAERLGASEVLVGVLVTAMQISWGPPQIFVGNLVARYPRAERARGYLEGVSAAAGLDMSDD